MLHLPALWYIDIPVICPQSFRRVKFVLIPSRFVQYQYLWNIAIQPSVSCYNVWANSCCSGCSLQGENLSEIGLFNTQYQSFKTSWDLVVRCLAHRPHKQRSRSSISWEVAILTTVGFQVIPDSKRKLGKILRNKYLISNITSEILMVQNNNMMTSSNGNIFRVTGHLCGEFTGPGEFPTQKPVTQTELWCFLWSASE